MARAEMVPILTMGDPAGIAPEITEKAWQVLRRSREVFAWIGDPNVLPASLPKRQIASAAEAADYFDHALPVIARPEGCVAIPGRPDVRHAPSIVGAIEEAVKRVQCGDACALITNPISKSVLSEGGFKYPGHTEFIAALLGALGDEIMLLVSPSLRVALTTVHVPLREAIDCLTSARVCKVARILNASLVTDFGISTPRIAIAGLNPHAGEMGRMGREDDLLIAPAVSQLCKEGIEARGPLPPDTMFTLRAREKYDAAVCMYHDQGLIPLKTLDFDHGVNTTIGLPIVRTSPDHGTAYDIAGMGIADEKSLIAAIRLAREMAFRRRELSGKVMV